MRSETFISYKKFRWLWITVGFLALSGFLYALDSPPGGRNGGTPLGYGLGIVSALAVAWLMAYGLRKRAYSSTLGTVEGWLAAHVWIGIGLLLLVPLLQCPHQSKLLVLFLVHHRRAPWKIRLIKCASCGEKLHSSNRKSCICGRKMLGGRGGGTMSAGGESKRIQL